VYACENPAETMLVKTPPGQQFFCASGFHGYSVIL
jgi:hypothetical protein